MKKLITLLALCTLFTIPSYAMNLDVAYDHYFAPNGGNNYDNGYGMSVRLEHDIYKGISGIVEGVHMTEIGFPCTDDPKGFFGYLRSYGVYYNLKGELPFNEQLSIYALAGIGVLNWDFKENPFLQDNKVTVDVDPSISLKAAVGAKYEMNEKWDAFAELGWMDTDIPKDSRDASGQVWNILDDGDISLRYITVKVGATYRF